MGLPEDQMLFGSWDFLLIDFCLCVKFGRSPLVSVWLVQDLQPQSSSQCVGVCVCGGGLFTT